MLAGDRRRACARRSSQTPGTRPALRAARAGQRAGRADVDARWLALVAVEALATPSVDQRQVLAQGRNKLGAPREGQARRRRARGAARRRSAVRSPSCGVRSRRRSRSRPASMPPSSASRAATSSRSRSSATSTSRSRARSRASGSRTSRSTSARGAPDSRARSPARRRSCASVPTSRRRRTPQQRFALGRTVATHRRGRRDARRSARRRARVDARRGVARRRSAGPDRRSPRSRPARRPTIAERAKVLKKQLSRKAKGVRRSSSPRPRPSELANVERCAAPRSAIGHRAGLVWAGDLAVALAVLDVGKGGRALVDSAPALDLVAWSVSEEYLKLREQARHRDQGSPMSGPDKPPPKGPVKPFLGENELSNELDAWDATFDALHGGPEAGQPANEEVMAWPTPAAAPVPPKEVSKPTRVPEPALVAADPSRTLDDFHPELEEQMTLDRAIEESTLDHDVPLRPSQARFANPVDAGPGETDFSDVGGTGSPSALGAILGSKHGDEDRSRDAPRCRAARRRCRSMKRKKSTRRPPGRTSRRRPTSCRCSTRSRRAAAGRGVPPSASARRSSGAQTPAAVPVKPAPQGFSDEDSPFAETTRVADFGELEQSRAKMSHADARSKAPTAPPPFAFSPNELAPPGRRGRLRRHRDRRRAADGRQVDAAAAEPPRTARRSPHVVRRPDEVDEAAGSRSAAASSPVIEVEYRRRRAVEPRGRGRFLRCRAPPSAPTRTDATLPRP